MFRRGALTVGRWKGAPIRLHWSLPVGLVVFTRFRWAPGAWLAFALLVLIHEFGHAILVRRYRLPVVGIDLTGLGGECHYGGSPSDWQRAVIAWGGVLAQALVAIACFSLAATVAPTGFVGEMVWLGTWPNLSLIGLNLIPIPPLDGSRAWGLFGMWRRRKKLRSARLAQRQAVVARAQAARHARVRRTEAKLAELERLDSLPFAMPDGLADSLKRLVDDEVARSRAEKASASQPGEGSGADGDETAESNEIRDPSAEEKAPEDGEKSDTPNAED